MKSPYTIIDKMILSEKISRGMEVLGSYCFKVHPLANKLEIKRAVEQIFNVHVTKVNTLHRKGKLKRERSMRYGRTAASKRAMVTLQSGEKIETV